MLVLNSTDYLGDKLLSPEEGVAKLREGNLKMAAQFKIPDQELLENIEMARGDSLHPNEFIYRLRKLDPELIVEDGGIPNCVAVRKFVRDEDGLQKKYLTGFYVDRAFPEFSSILPDKNGLAKREIRGWRTVLLNLLRTKAVTYKQVKAVFGEPQGQRNSLWMQQTRGMR